MPLTATGIAHRRRCRLPCEHWRIHRALMDERGDRWADYCAAAGHDPTGWVCLAREFLEGPDSNCPAGYWDGLPPVDLAAEQAQGRINQARAQVEALGPVLEKALALRTAAEKEQAVDRLAAAGLIEPEAADALKAGLTMGRATE